MMNLKASFIFFITLAFVANLKAQSGLDTSSFLKDTPGVYGLLVMQHSRLLVNSYYNDSTANSLFNDQSLTKGICSILIGIAIEQKKIRSVDQKLSDFFPSLKSDPDPRKRTVTIRQVMNQASGLYHEDIERIDLLLSNPNPSKLVLTSPMAANPGSEWHYNNAASHLLSLVITKATGKNTRAFAVDNLFKKIGITRFDWMKMRDGFYDGSGLLSIRLRLPDMLKIGQLLLNNGVYKGKQIIPAQWVRQIMLPDLTYPATWGFSQSRYALCWYHKLFNGTPVTYGMGWGGQFLVIIPSLNAVVAINQNVSDANAIRQSDNFIENIFPVIYNHLKSPGPR